MARLSEFRQEYIDILIECLSNGMLDCEIYNVLDCSDNTFRRWRKEYPEFSEAYDRGMPKCEAWWVRKMKQKWLDGDDKGFKYCSLIMKSKFNYSESQINSGVTNNTQINVQGNVNILESKSIKELQDTIQDNLIFLQDANLIEANLIDDQTQSNEQDS